METTQPQTKKPWADPELFIIARNDVNNGTHTAFKEVSQLNPLSFKIVKNTPLHKTYVSSIGGWNFAGHS